MVHDLPGVGENLQDHIGGRIIYRCVAGTVTMNEIYHNWLRRLYAGRASGSSRRKGPLMTGAGPIGLFVKTRPELDSPGRAVSVPGRQCAEDRRPDAPFPRLHAGGDPMPAGEPRLAAHHLAPIRKSRRRCSRTTCPPSADKDTIVAGLRVSRAHLRHPGDAAIRHRGDLPGPQAQPTRTC